MNGLNPEQREAVETLDGPVLLLAGAGTGKTRALTTRLAHILNTGRARPWEILSVTFTNKAAREMRARVGELIGEAVEGLPWLGTFHSIAAQILRRHAELVDLKPSFTILDTDDQIRLIKQILQAENIDEKRWTPRYFASLVDGWKNRGLTPDRVSEEDAYAFANGRGKDLYKIYQDRLGVLNAADFGDLLLHNLTIFQNNPDVLKDYHARFRYLLVDEYQDTNVAQYLWLRFLAQGSKNLCVVGDDDQSIYGWRGAEVDNILRFEKDFPGAKVIRLERNYRSTQHILSAASGLIASNKSRLGKELWTDDQGGEKVQVRGVWDGEAEARAIAEEIENWVSHKRPYSDVAVLVRASWQMRAFEDRFIMTGLPYRVVGGPRFFERAEIRDAHAYLRLVRQDEDDLAFERIVNTPKRGVGATTVQKLQRTAREMRVPLTEATRLLLQTDEIKGPARAGLSALLKDVDRWRVLAETAKHDELAETVLDESGYTAMWREDKSPQAAGRLDNLKELVRSMGEYDTLEAYLEHVSLLTDADRQEEEDEVSLMTLHSAKGLEFPLVMLPGWEEGVFPSQRSLDEGGMSALEEERRLAYVGITRARERAMIWFAANRQIYGRWQAVIPSRFIDELPPEHVDAESQTNYFDSGPGFGGLKENVETFDSSYSSPGWRRMQAAKGRDRAKPPTIEAEATLMASSDPGEARFRPGTRVFHDKFGYGDVVSVDGAKLDVNFDHTGRKKVIASFVEAA
ncbi:MAG: UvrD-helicase domain-containing protein [Euryhalocaulis sp.]|uniref:ATP-dependent helicase n=1 Tax=Euryhalocaulis sp. TaxID=2744307 RepID=UPI00185C0151|nr:UvrD-helicase domain-containing protein [Euryhalocaulis sp.]